MEYCDNYRGIPTTLERRISEVPDQTVTLEEYRALGGLPMQKADDASLEERRLDSEWRVGFKLPNVTEAEVVVDLNLKEL